MAPSGITATQRNWTARIEAPWLERFFGKMVLDVLPAALASLIGGFLFTQYHFGHVAPPQLVNVQPASPEMMAMVRDEHALIMNYLNAQMAAEQRRDLAEDADSARAAAEARAAAAAKLADALAASQAPAEPSAAPVPPAKTAVTHRKPPAVIAAAPHQPLEIAQADPADNDAVAARDSDSFLANPLIAKTLDIKDHVVAATRHVVSVIGEMFASVGDSFGGAKSDSRPFNPTS